MKDVHEAIVVIGQTLDLAGFGLNSNDQAELIFGEDFSAYLTKVDDSTLELSFRLEMLDYADPAIMTAMLQANALGSGVGGGRLAIDPGNKETIYCERWKVSEVSAEEIEAKLLEFAEYGVFWMTDGVEMIVGSAAAEFENSDPSPEAEVFLKI